MKSVSISRFLGLSLAGFAALSTCLSNTRPTFAKDIAGDLSSQAADKTCDSKKGTCEATSNCDQQVDGQAASEVAAKCSKTASPKDIQIGTKFTFHLSPDLPEFRSTACQVNATGSKFHAVSFSAAAACDKPACDKPACDKPACDKPACDKPACDKPACDKPACDKPACAKPACDKPVCDKPVCDKPVCDKPVCDKPVCDKPVCDKPVCDKPVCDKVACAKATCDKVACNKPACDKSACDKPACDKPACDKSACDKSACDKSACDKSACDKAACDKAVCPEAKLTSYNQPLTADVGNNQPESLCLADFLTTKELAIERETESGELARLLRQAGLENLEVPVAANEYVRLLVEKAEAKTRLAMTEQLMSERVAALKQIHSLVERNSQLAAQAAVAEVKQQMAESIAASIMAKSEAYAQMVASDEFHLAKSIRSNSPVPFAKTELGTRARPYTPTAHLYRLNKDTVEMDQADEHFAAE